VIATDLEFVVPAALEARRPPEMRGVARDRVRLLASDARTGELRHHTFAELPGLLRRGDLLVVNDSATLPAALDVRRPDGSPIALHFSARIANSLYVVEPRGPRVTGDVLSLPAGGRVTLLTAADRESDRLWYARVELPEPYVEYLYRHGRPIRYAYVDETFPIAAYQTIFARLPGSAEMPSAGRPFTARTCGELRAAGVGIARLTLHTGVSSAEAHEPPQAEPYSVPRETADLVNATRDAGGRVIAIGTTVVRALESSVSGGSVVASNGWTDLIVTKDRGVRAVDGILTGFHEPRASHLQMLQAFAERDALEAAYREALEGGYLWHEFGDVHLIL
jgi:S-adenosylmethionine:tRNA ribosyltransferase-isomerase